MNKNRKSFIKSCFIGLLLEVNFIGMAQQPLVLTIDSCYWLAERHYPLVKQYALIDQSEAYSVSNVSKGYWPQINLAGQATYQSDVTKIPISLPNIEIPGLSKDQYKIYAEVTQPVTDLLTVTNNRQLAKANAAVERQKTEVDLYKLKEHINALFFGILLIDAQIKQAALKQEDIRTGLSKTRVAIENGTAFKSNADMLEAELLNADQRIIELKALRRGYADRLSLFIGLPVNETTVLEKPPAPWLSATVNRPELRLLEKQKSVLDIRDKLVTSKNLPRISLFLQGGYGRPTLNFLDNGFGAYYIGGVRLSWNIAGLYTYKKEKKNLVLSKDMLDVQQEVFLFNTNLALEQQYAEIVKWQELMEADTDIIRLRENVKITTQKQLEYGTATANDYILQVNAEDNARQNLLLHEIQLMMVLYNYKATTGN
ncbi:MAG TPA: transporter [Porphyromonadaceae bacterium]|nr:transporter [Porphyromonadaceae bacterium]